MNVYVLVVDISVICARAYHAECTLLDVIMCVTDVVVCGTNVMDVIVRAPDHM